MKILLVEDDTALRGALEELLSREGYEVIKASNVRSAVEAMNPEIDLAMLDVGLPDGDGVSLCRKWRSEGLEMPILFLTAKDEERSEMSLARILYSVTVSSNTSPSRLACSLALSRVIPLLVRVLSF